MKYTVKYKLKSSWFSKTIKNVTADFVYKEAGVIQRVFILEDETRIEVPFEGTQFMFSKERYVVIKKNMERESGQTIPVLR